MLPGNETSGVIFRIIKKSKMEQNRRGLNRNQIKYILIVAMVIDHIAWGFVDRDTMSWQVMHFFGRLTGPGMSYFLVEGYHHTGNVNAYIRRLGIFAFLSWPAFAFFEKGKFLYPNLGMIYTLFLSLLLLKVYDTPFMNAVIKEYLMIALMGLSLLGDWAGFGPCYVLCFHVFRNDKRKMWAVYCLLSLLTFSYNGFKLQGAFQSGVYLVPLLLMTYNGESGSKHPFHKWFFYVFYPAHLLLLGYFRWK